MSALERRDREEKYRCRRSESLAGVEEVEVVKHTDNDTTQPLEKHDRHFDTNITTTFTCLFVNQVSHESFQHSHRSHTAALCISVLLCFVSSSERSDTPTLATGWRPNRN